MIGLIVRAWTILRRKKNNKKTFIQSNDDQKDVASSRGCSGLFCRGGFHLFRSLVAGNSQSKESFLCVGVGGTSRNARVAIINFVLICITAGVSLLDSD
jgi:hypothetical protein